MEEKGGGEGRRKRKAEGGERGKEEKSGCRRNGEGGEGEVWKGVEWEWEGKGSKKWQSRWMERDGEGKERKG